MKEFIRRKALLIRRKDFLIRRKDFLILLGPQGSGKSTQAEMLAQALNIPHIEMGQLLRDKITEDDEDSKLIKSAMETGNLVPNKITIRTLGQRLKQDDCKNGFVLDGYPRDKEQFDALPEGIDRAIYIKVPDEEVIQRLMKRGREDDQEELIKRRLELYHQETEPLLETLKEKGMLEEIDGTGTIEEVNRVVLAKFANGAS